MEQVSSIDFDTPPGTVYLAHRASKSIQLDPEPTNDPNDPLDGLSNQTVLWQQMIPDLQVGYAQLNNALAINYAGTATGCIFFIPFAIKYGRRPVYLVSTCLMAGVAFWSAKMQSVPELYITSLLCGLGGSTNEAIVQMTVADLFFVHQHGRMNGIYSIAVTIGSFLTPVAAGAQAQHSGWRWSYWALAIASSAIFLLFLCFFEESKYLPVLNASATTGQAGSASNAGVDAHVPEIEYYIANPTKALEDAPNHVAQLSQSGMEQGSPPMQKRIKRLRLISPSNENLWATFLKPLKVLVLFPAITYTAVLYGFCLVWIAVTSSVQAVLLPYAPWDFNPTQVGLMGLGPFLGTTLGAVYGGLLGDQSIVYFSRRNKGYYEPEMRLYLQPIPVLSMTAGLLMFGITISKEFPWPYQAGSSLIFGFGIGGVMVPSLTFTMDSYPELVGEAFVGIAFVRNILSVGILFALAPWMEAQGTQNMFIVMGVIAFVMAATFLPMIHFGKSLRKKTATRYRKLASIQRMHRH